MASPTGSPAPSKTVPTMLTACPMPACGAAGLEGPAPAFVREGADGLGGGDRLVRGHGRRPFRYRTASRRGRAARCRNVAEHLLADRLVHREVRAQALARGDIGHALEDRIEGEQRVVGEVHLRHQPLRQHVAEEREMDVRRPPRFGMVAPGVGPGLDADEAVAAVGVGHELAVAVEVRIERRVVLVAAVEVAAGRVRLPDLDQRIAHRLAVLVRHAAGDDDLLAERRAGAVARQVGIERLEQARRETRHAAHRGGVAHAQRLLARPALRGGPVGGVEEVSG